LGYITSFTPLEPEFQAIASVKLVNIQDLAENNQDSMGSTLPVRTSVGCCCRGCSCRCSAARSANNAGSTARLNYLATNCLLVSTEVSLYSVRLNPASGAVIGADIMGSELDVTCGREIMSN